MRWCKEIHARVATRALAGGIKGGALGVAGSLATGAAVVFTAPAWMPFAAGTAVISLGTIAAWGATGSALVAAVAGTRTYLKFKDEEEAFARAFPSVDEIKKDEPKNETEAP